MVFTKKTPEMVDRLRQLAGEGKHAAIMGPMLGVSSVSVSNWAREEKIDLPNGREIATSWHPQGRKKKMTPEIIEKVRELAARGLFMDEIAKEMGVHRDTIQVFVSKEHIKVADKRKSDEWRRQAGERSRQRFANPEFRERLFKAKRARLLRELAETGGGAPEWVPMCFRAAYLSLAHEHGEEIAAGLARKFKRDLSEATASVKEKAI